MREQHNYKIGQQVYLPTRRKYYYINGIHTNKGYWLTGIEDFTLSLNAEPNKATKHDKTFRVQPGLASGGYLIMDKYFWIFLMVLVICATYAKVHGVDL
ncbi:hypothetical protein [Acinetobacter baumannii]|uniref:hypothetical protein n=1 Tax=Acinetobacter baumannii TaxID=470 RepID=UPI0021C68AC4|nr:hypothetical protein [Acinetobacter baumannii]